MQRLLYSLRGLGAISVLLVMGVFVRDGHAADKKSPLRGRWSASQVSYVNPPFGSITTTGVATLTVDDQGGMTMHGTINSACTAAGSDCPVSNPLELEASGTITSTDDGTAVMTLVLPVFGITVGRTCVLMEKHGACYQEFHYINTSPNGEVVLAEFKRQLAGTCQ